MQLHKLACSYISLHAVTWNCMQLHELACSYMNLHAVTWACMQLHELACSSFVWAAHKNFAVLVKILLLLLKSTDMIERVWYKYVGVEVLSQQFNRTNWRKNIIFFWKKMLWSILIFSVLSIPALSISFKLFVKKGLIKSVFNQTSFFLFFISGINNV